MPGIAALIGLNILKHFDVQDLDRWHVRIEAMRLAFEDARWYVTDPAFSPTPLAELLSDEYAARRAGLIRMDRIVQSVRPGAPSDFSDTVYFCVVERLSCPRSS